MGENRSADGAVGGGDRSRGLAESPHAPRLRLGFALVRGRSMLPTLAPGDRLLVRYVPLRPAGSPARGLEPGRLVLCLPPGRPVAVKRLGRRFDDGRCWVESDNADEGTDSRTFGPLPDRFVIAVVVCRVWPHPSRLSRRSGDRRRNATAG